MNSCIYISYSGSGDRKGRVTASGEDTTLVYSGIAATYDEIDIANTMNVKYSDSADCITVIADKNLVPYIKVYVEGGELKINMKGVSLFNTPSPMVTVPVSTKPLKSIDVSGASKFSSDVILEGKELSIDLSGASKAELEAKVDELDADLSGASMLNIGGISDEAELCCSGASKINCDEFSTDYADVHVSGASRIGCLDAKAAAGSVSGASSIKFSKECDAAKVSTSGASSISFD